MKLDVLLRLERTVAGHKSALEAELAAVRNKARVQRQRAAECRQRAVLGQAGASAFEMQAHLAWQTQLIGRAQAADAAASAAELLAGDVSKRLAKALSREIALAKMIETARRAKRKSKERRAEDEAHPLGKQS